MRVYLPMLRALDGAVRDARRELRASDDAREARLLRALRALRLSRACDEATERGDALPCSLGAAPRAPRREGEARCASCVCYGIACSTCDEAPAPGALQRWRELRDARRAKRASRRLARFIEGGERYAQRARERSRS